MKFKPKMSTADILIYAAVSIAIAMAVSFFTKSVEQDGSYVTKFNNPFA